MNNFNYTPELPVYMDRIYDTGLVVLYSCEFLSIVHAVGLVVYEVTIHIKYFGKRFFECHKLHPMNL